MVTTAAHTNAMMLPHEHPRMGWGAVFAGWFVATGVAGLLYVFGLAVGFSAFDPYHPVAAANGPAVGVIVWLILTWGAALWIGSMFASWFDGGNDTEMGVVRGLTVWGLSITATGLLLVSGQAHFMFVTSPAGLAAGEIDAAAIAHNTAAAMWSAFGAAVLSLITSAFGGWMGARHVHRVYHLRTYTTPAPR